MLSTKLRRTLSFGHLNFSSGALHHHRKADCCCIVASFIMSPVSRGFAGFLRQQSFRLPSSLRAAVFGGREQFFQPNTIRNSRNFGSSFLRRYEYQYKSQLAQKPSVFVNNDPVLRQVAQTRQPVTIYRAPKNRWYYLKVYGTAALWIGTGAYSIKFQDDVKDLKDLAFFIRPTYVVVGIGFIIIGSYICTAPVNRMRALEVLPSIHGGPMQLRMTVRSAPWTKERVVFANLGGPTISEKTNPMVEELMEAERARKQSVFQGLEHESIITRSWEYSARWVHQKWTNFFLSFKFAVLRFGIAKVEVQGEKWKIDCSGWLLEDGKAIDRLIPEE